MNEKGSALIYILIAIALLAALTATFMDSSSQQTTSQNTFNTVTDLNSQVNFIRSAVQECVLTFPEVEPGLSGASNMPYPINPTSTYFTPSTLGVATTNKVENLRCPGNPGVNTNHAVIFGGSSGKFLPPIPRLFTPWTYYNGPDGVFFFTSTTHSDSFLLNAMTKLDDQYSECEADVINNSAGGALNITISGGTGRPQCPANSYCFRVWMIKNATVGSPYVGDSDSDEAACP